MNINNLKIIVKSKYNFGYKVGVTVHVNGKKFPTEKILYMHITKTTKQFEQL